MNTITTISSKYQMVVPKAIRQFVKLKAGTRVSVSLVNEKNFLVSLQPTDYVKAMRGLGKDVWKKLGGGEKYLKRERASWDK